MNRREGSRAPAGQTGVQSGAYSGRIDFNAKARRRGGREEGLQRDGLKEGRSLRLRRGQKLKVGKSEGRLD